MQHMSPVVTCTGQHCCRNAPYDHIESGNRETFIYSTLWCSETSEGRRDRKRGEQYQK